MISQRNRIHIVVGDRCLLSVGLLVLLLSIQTCYSQHTQLQQDNIDSSSGNTDSVAALDAVSRQVESGFDRLEQSMSRVNERTTNCNCRCEQQTITRQGQSYSAHATQPSQGFVRLNGREIWRAGWISETIPNLRGLNAFVVDPFLCTQTDVRIFDMWEKAESANDLVAYIQYLREGAVVLGVSADEPTRYIAPALRTLGALGVFVDDVRERGNYAFVLQKGYSGKTIMRKSQTYSQHGSNVNVRIQGSSVEDLVFTSV